MLISIDIKTKECASLRTVERASPVLIVCSVDGGTQFHVFSEDKALTQAWVDIIHDEMEQMSRLFGRWPMINISLAPDG